MEPTKEQILEWTKALRSGKYQQGKKRLHGEDGYCCLGVACLVFIQSEKIRIASDGYLFGDVPANQREAPKWLRDINNDFFDKTDEKLSALNDYSGFTFDMIADLLELVYIHKALE